MAECVSSPSCLVNHRGCTPHQNLTLRMPHGCRKYSYGTCKVLRISTWKMWELTHSVSYLKLSPCLRGTSLKSTCLGSLVNPDGATTSDWIAVVDQVLLMASVFLTYTAGVIPVRKKSFLKFPKNVYHDDVASGTSSGSAMKNDDQLNSKYALNVVKGKLLDSLKALEHCQNLEERVREFEEHHAKGPLSLNAVPEGPRLHLLWASFQQVEEEVTNTSSIPKTAKMEDWLTVFPDIIQRSCQPVCMAWLENVLCLENSTTSKELASLIYEKLKGEDTVLQNIRKSGKGDLYAELLCFLRFGSQREDCCYDNSIFLLHGVSILEDLVITLADGIASIFLELISVDGNLSNEMNSLGLALCTLSTRALQRLRNEVALSQWLYLNVEAVVSMYEDRFDLWTLQNQLIEAPRNSQTENYSWWKRLTLRKFDTVLSPIHYTVISQFSMPVKRMKELRALRGWRYYFSLLLELSDISMPLIKAVISKVSDAISFFLVCLIGRSLGLIYTGIRQSLRWK
ncbi:uncharacterized protein LOC112026550 isoform X2 [Quercus suber]|uniref:uncharacterized protein LOC112026550 isoform X2 n=1 Tax=Quercus suber TaxID=58331 RepID=UPI0032DE3CBF